jgi:hypothetical protein
MTKKVKVILNWDGPYEDPNAVPKRAGIYMVIAGSKLSNGSFSTSSYEVLDIGQSGETGVRLDTHDRRDCWCNRKPANKTILFKFAAMPSDSYDETDRRIVECCLRAHTKPPCGTECNEGYKREDSVIIINKGNRTPLKEEYSCG